MPVPKYLVDPEVKETHDKMIAEAVAQGGCPLCGCLQNHIVPSDSRLSQCQTCGNRFEKKEGV